MRVIVEISLQDACTLDPSLLQYLHWRWRNRSCSSSVELGRASLSPPSVYLVSSLLPGLSALSKVDSSQSMRKEIAIITWMLLST